MPSVEAYIHETQRKYLSNILNNPTKHPLLYRIMEMGRNVRLRSGHLTRCAAMKHIDKITEQNDTQRIVNDMKERQIRIAGSAKTKTMLYKQWCPDLTTHDVYITRKYFPESWRIAWTRFRLGSTNLPCEKRRWNNTDTASCICGQNQTEIHILLECEERIVRATSIAEFFDQQDQRAVMKCIFESLLKFEKR
jgi:hypothetical protein